MCYQFEIVYNREDNESKNGQTSFLIINDLEF